MIPPDIVAARLYQVAIPLREPFAISGGTMTTRESLIVELEDQHGRLGWGESAPFALPFYSGETVASARALLTTALLPSVVGWHGVPLEEARDWLALGVRGNRMARAGVETALWDLTAAARGVPLADLVSERLAALDVAPQWRERKSELACGIALGVPPDQDGRVLAQWVHQALAAGYQRIKVKVRPGWDEEPVRVTQDTMRVERREVPLWVDANGAYDLARDENALRALDRMGLVFLEQPLAEEAWWDLCELGRMLRTPVCLDETLVSDDVGRQMLLMGGPEIWNIKIQRVGGLEEACRIYARAMTSGVRVWGGTMPETGLGAQAMLALGGHTGFVFPSDIEPSDRWYSPGADVVELSMTARGTMPVPAARSIPRRERWTPCWRSDP